MKFNTYFLFLALSAAFISGPAAATISLNGTRVVFDGRNREATVTVSNQGEDILIQSWLEPQHEDDPELPFVVTPPLARLPAKQQQLIRVLYEGSGMPTDKESAFWLNVQEIPQTAPGENLLQLAVRQRIKVFYRPPELSDDVTQAPENLQWRLLRENGKTLLRADNPSRFHITLVALQFGAGKSGKPISDANMIAPGASQQWELPANGALPDAELNYSIINDFGGYVAYRVQLSGEEAVKPKAKSG